MKNISILRKASALAAISLSCAALTSCTSMRPLSEQDLEEEEAYVQENYPEFTGSEVNVVKIQGEGMVSYGISVTLPLGDDLSVATPWTLDEIRKYISEENPGRSVSVSYKFSDGSYINDSVRKEAQQIFDSAMPASAYYDVVVDNSYGTDFMYVVGYDQDIITPEDITTLTQKIQASTLSSIYDSTEVLLLSGDYTRQSVMENPSVLTGTDEYNSSCISYDNGESYTSMIEYENDDIMSRLDDRSSYQFDDEIYENLIRIKLTSSSGYCENITGQ